MDNHYTTPLLTDFNHVVDHDKHATIPETWFVVITDVVNSTIAIGEGRYKDVNVIGASTIISVINSVHDHEIPFIFGGDGASFLLPASAKDRALKALLESSKMAKEMYGLQLRIGIVPVKELMQKGYEIKLANFQMSPSLSQSVFSGDGLAIAEEWVKDPRPDNPYLAIQTEPCEQKELYKGLECRWCPVQSKQGTYISLIVVCNHQSQSQQKELFNKVLTKIDEIYQISTDPYLYDEDQLSISKQIADHSQEATVRTQGQGLWPRLLYQLKSYLLSNIMTLYWDFISEPEWKKYKKEVTENSDFRKFDGALRMVLDGSEDQASALRSFLEEHHKAGELCYGIHLSQDALITCMIFNKKEGRHLHLVDGGGGGYTAASKQLKKQLKDTSNRSQP